MIAFLVTNKLPAALKGVSLEVLASALSKALRIRREEQISVTFVTETAMQALNTRYRGKRKPTDVLSFETVPLMKGEKQIGPVDRGDVFVCAAYARREAKRRGLSEREELVRLLIHGVLHVHGFDHGTEREELRMFGLQERLVSDFLRTDV